MFLEIISLLVLVIVVVSPLLLARYISANLQKSRDLDRVKQDRIIRLISEFEKEVTEAMQLVVNCQRALDKEIGEFTKLVGIRNEFIVFQYEQFNALAKSDMISARREELLRTKELKVALERLMGVAMTSRQPPAPNDVLALEKLTNRIEELESILSDNS